MNSFAISYLKVFLALVSLFCIVNLFCLPPAAESLSSESESADEQSIKFPRKAAGKVPCLSFVDTRQEVKAAILCIHGLSLYKGAYAEFGKAISEAGIACYAIDLRGFGELKAVGKNTSMDFDGCLADIKATLEEIHRKHPNVPVLILGESMGGAVALRATALYPELIAGLVSSVPAKDRFSLGGESVWKVGSHVVTSGFGSPIKDVAEPVVKRVSSKEDVRSRWKTDPLMRMSFSARELMQFNEFMSKNLEYAREIKTVPVLFIVGAKDRLIRPAGTWKVFERVPSSRKQLVLSKNSEHLIFEAGQFNAEDMSFLRLWIDRNIAQLSPGVLAADKEQAAVVASLSNPNPNFDEKTENAEILATKPPEAKVESATERVETLEGSGLSYWIEMARDGKIFRCNNKTEFRSGDQIRFHVIPDKDGYAYLVMRQGTSGNSMMLFPSAASGEGNYLRKGRDYVLPGKSWMQFDANPGLEKLSLVLSKEQINIDLKDFTSNILTCYVSPARDGAKDIVPTRMKLSWDDPKPVILPEDFAAGAEIAAGAGSMVHLVSNAAGAYLAVDIALIHR